MTSISAHSCLNDPAGPGAQMSFTVAAAMQKLVTHQPAEPPSRSPAVQPEQPYTDVQTAIDEIATLKAQISGVEAAVTLIRSATSSPADSRRSPSQGRRSQQQQQPSQGLTTGQTNRSIADHLSLDP